MSAQQESAHHNPYAYFSDALGRVAEQWPEWHPETAAPIQEHVRYNVAADAAVLILQKKGDLSRETVTANIPFSCKVMMRYCLLAAQVAKREGITDIDAVRDIVRQSKSYGVLGKIAKSQQKVARNVETDYGLRPPQYPLHEMYVDKFTLDDDTALVLKHDTSSMDIKRAKTLLQLDGYEINENAQCPAVRSLKPILGHFATIAAADRNLFERTLSE